MTLPALLTGRLRLRPWAENDAAAFHQLWGDPRVIWWGHTPTAEASRRKLDEVLARCAAMPEGLGWWAVETLAGGAVLGNIVLQPASYDGTVELGYHLTHEAWGRGYATEGAGAALRHGFSTLALAEVSAVVHEDNHASQRVISRLGLRATGPITFNGMPHLRYEMTRQEALTRGWGASAGS